MISGNRPVSPTITSKPQTQSQPVESQPVQSEAPVQEKPKLWTQNEETGEWMRNPLASPAIKNEDPTIQKQRENISSTITAVRNAAEQIDPQTLDADATQTRALMDTIRKNPPPFLDHKMIGKTKSEAGVKLKSGHKLLREKAIEPLNTKQLSAQLQTKKAELGKLMHTAEKMQKQFGPGLQQALNALPTKQNQLNALRQQLKGASNVNTQRTLQSKISTLQGSINGLKAVTDLSANIATVRGEIQDLQKTLATGGTTWERVKATHIDQVTSSTKLQMVMALDSRLSEFNETATNIGKEMGIPVVLPGQEPPTDTGYLKVTICGSTELSSDIDVNVTPVNLPTGTETQFMMKYNAHNQSVHGDQTGNKYDINVYNAMNNKFPNVEAEIAKGSESAPARTRVLSPEAQTLNDKNESIISYMAMNRFMSPTQFSLYKTTMLQNVETLAPTKKLALQAKIESGAEISQGNETALTERMEQLKSSGEYEGLGNKEIELIASNQLYEERSQLAHQGTESAETDVESVGADFDMTKAHYFANEAAYTSGVLRATVAKEQIVPGINEKREKLGQEPIGMIDISNEEYASAARENTANTFKEINHHSSSAPELLFRASKYFGRANRNYQDVIQQSGVQLDQSGQNALKFLNKLSAAESYGKDDGLLAIRKDKIGGDNPLKMNENEDRSAAKLRLASEIMTKHGLGEFLTNPPQQGVDNLINQIVTSYAILDAQVSAHLTA